MNQFKYIEHYIIFQNAFTIFGLIFEAHIEYNFGSFLLKKTFQRISSWNPICVRRFVVWCSLHANIIFQFAIRMLYFLAYHLAWIGYLLFALLRHFNWHSLCISVIYKSITEIVAKPDVYFHSTNWNWGC